MKIVNLLMLLVFQGFISLNANGQRTPPENASVPDRGGRFIKQDATGVYFTGLIDTASTVFYSTEMDSYKLFNRKGKLVEAGSLAPNYTDGYDKEGKWTRYYDNGKISSIRYMHSGKLTGPVDTFYKNGKLALRYNVALVRHETVRSCVSGLYQEYYDNGKLKMEGFYAVNTDSAGFDSVSVTDPVTAVAYIVLEKITVPSPEKVGEWTFYDEAGKMIKTEHYH